MSIAEPTALTRFVERLKLRSTLAPAEVEAIVGLPGKVMIYGAHHDIVRMGDRTNAAYLVIDGLAARFDMDKRSERQITALHIPGDMCDLHSILLPVANSGIEALTKTAIMKVPHAALRAIAVQNPAIATAFWRDSMVDAGVLAKWVANLGRKDSRARFAHLLCEIAFRMEYAGLGSRASFPFKMTQQNIADALGLTLVHVNRKIQELRSDGLIQTSKGTVNILDWTGLAEIADFRSSYLQVSDECVAIDSLAH
jgi:CRP-like cAMP-binding protein